MLYGYSYLELFLMWYACGLVSALWQGGRAYVEGVEVVVSVKELVCIGLFSLLGVPALIFTCIEMLPSFEKILVKPILTLKRKEK